MLLSTAVITCIELRRLAGGMLPLCRVLLVCRAEAFVAACLYFDTTCCGSRHNNWTSTAGMWVTPFDPLNRLPVSTTRTYPPKEPRRYRCFRCHPLVRYRIQVNDLGAMELLPVRSFFAEALASLYVVSGQKSADQRARDLEEKLPTARGGGSGSAAAAGNGTEDGDGDVGAAAAGLGVMEAAGEEQEQLRPRRVRRFAS